VWIVFRLLLALLGFGIRRFGALRRRRTDSEFEGVAYGVDVRRRKGKIRGFSIWMLRKSPTWLRLHRESVFDRWVKRVGIAKELQAGDPRFDALVYVTCDHPFIGQAFARSKQLRDAVVDVFESGYERVEFDGTRVVLSRDTESEPSAYDLKLLKQVFGASERFESIVPNRFAEPFLWKALAVEGVIWSLFGYAIGAVTQLLVAREDLHVAPRSVLFAGLAFGCVLLLLLLGAIALFMRGSSRGHRVIVESGLILALALPTAGVQLVSDTNRALDGAAPRHLTAAVERCEVRVHRGKNGRKSHTYHLQLSREPGTPLPESVEVTREVCNAARSEQQAEFTVRPGRWGLPWYEAIDVGHTRWEAQL